MNGALGSGFLLPLEGLEGEKKHHAIVKDHVHEPVRPFHADIRKIAENDYGALGDTSTLADPSVVDALIEGRKNR